MPRMQALPPIRCGSNVMRKTMAALNLLSVFPILPDWLPEITLRNLRVGKATVTIRFWRKDNGASTFQVIEKHGTLHVIAQPPIESTTAGIWDRRSEERRVGKEWRSRRR